MRKSLTLPACVCALLVVAETANLVPDTFEEAPAEAEDDVAGLPACDDVTKAVDDAKEGPFAEVSYLDPADPVGVTDVGASVYVFSKAKKAKRFANTLTTDDAARCASAKSTTLPQLAGSYFAPLRIRRSSGFESVVKTEAYVLVVQQVRARFGRAVLVVRASSQNGPLPFIEDFTIGLEEALGEAV